MSTLIFSKEVYNLFYGIYDSNPENLKTVALKLGEKGLSYMEILKLTTQELKIPLGEAIMLLEIPDYLE